MSLLELLIAAKKSGSSMYNVHIPTKVAKIAETVMYPQQFWQPPGCFRQIPLVEKISLY